MYLKNLDIDKSLFWDADFDKLTLEDNYYFIIKRIILRGSRNERRFMFENFNKEQLLFVLNNAREIPNNLKEIYLMAIND